MGKLFAGEYFAALNVWWMWLLLLVLIGLVGFLIYLRTQKDEDDD
jgi:hypothetical protein